MRTVLLLLPASGEGDRAHLQRVVEGLWPSFEQAVSYARTICHNGFDHLATPAGCPQNSAIADLM